MTTPPRMRRLPILPALLASCTLVACDLEFDKSVVPGGAQQTSVHLVLNPYDRETFHALVERTLGGRVETNDGRYDPDDVVVSTGGEPVTGARVSVHRIEPATPPDSGIAFAGEDRIGGGKGRGMYELINAGCGPLFCPLNGIAISPGYTYELRVELPGQLLTARTTVPEGLPRPDTAIRITFSTAEKYTFSWPKATGPFQRYAVQVQTPFGPYQTFSAAESLSIDGSLRNFQRTGFPRVFVPGFLQVLQSLAVDRAYYEYFRSANGEFTGAGLVSNIRGGGTGVFGAAQPIRTQFVDIVAPFDQPEDGIFELLGATTNFPARLTVYVDGTFASGQHYDVFDPELITRRGVLGTRTGTGLRLQVLAGQSARDSAWTLEAQYRGDTLVTTSPDAPEKGTQRWLRVRS